MATQTKQEVSVETKPAAAQKKAAEQLLMRPYEEFERFFERVLGRDWRKPFAWGTPAWGDLMGPLEARLPSIDMIDRDDHVLIRAEVPGVDKKDLSVSISENVLTIKGESTKEKKDETGDYFRHEISCGSFSRSVALPVNVDASKVNATLTDGVLEVTVGKAAGSKRLNVKIQ